MSAPLVTIVIPTFRRPESLSRLLTSIAADLNGRSDVAIVVADNDAGKSAEDAVKSASDGLDMMIEYRVAFEPGVSNARNKGMEGLSSRYVLFLDDDMEVVPPFLDPLMAASLELNSTLTFSAAIASLPEGTETLSPWLSPLFSHTMGGDTRIVTETLGTGGCLVDLHDVELASPVFDPALNETGGEDDVFFGHIIAQGGTVGWCADATSWEHVPPHRATTRYLWRRHFAFGQTPTREAADRGLSGIITISKWMAVGAVQTTLHGGLYLAHALMGRPSRIEHLGRTAQGLGKILWWDGLSPRLYGANAR